LGGNEFYSRGAKSCPNYSHLWQSTPINAPYTSIVGKPSSVLENFDAQKADVGLF